MPEEASSGNFYPAWQPLEATPPPSTRQEMVYEGNLYLELGTLSMLGAVSGSIVAIFSPNISNTPIRISLGIVSLGSAVLSTQNLRSYASIRRQLNPGDCSRQPSNEQ